MEQNSLENILEKVGFGKFQYILIIICGILQSFDAIEILILEVLHQRLKCDWQTTVLDDVNLKTGVFVGMMFGGLFIGGFNDIFGRRLVLIISTLSFVVVGLLSSASPTIVWLTLTRSIIGACYGGMFTSFATLFSELVPTTSRGDSTISILAIRPIGLYLITIMYLLVVPSTGWRFFLLITDVPIILLIPFIFWVPKSPRFLMLKSHHEEAAETTNRIARINKTETETVLYQPLITKSSVSDLLHRNYLATTLITISLWFVSGFSYYGIIVISTSIGSLQNCAVDAWYTEIPGTDESCCADVSWSASRDTLISTTAELIFIPLTILMINFIGRRYSIAIFSVFVTASFAVMNFCVPSILTTAIMFLSRGSVSACLNINYLYASEVFPTSSRGLAIGLCNATGKLGAIIALYVINFVMPLSSFLEGSMVFIVFNAAAFVGALMLPYETKGRPLQQNSEM